MVHRATKWSRAVHTDSTQNIETNPTLGRATKQTRAGRGRVFQSQPSQTNTEPTLTRASCDRASQFQLFQTHIEPTHQVDHEQHGFETVLHNLMTEHNCQSKQGRSFGWGFEMLFESEI
ncbi:uncharacterized protein LOC115986810 [Quercus lobata]|uniref:uncharacterized protein LOC115986810 n=1 Tax=Quercus lobata TaxID=97700 RepID=UPI001244497A|nr:uncharacterized protein LOC115986810 [Quercus lobata]